MNKKMIALVTCALAFSALPGIGHSAPAKKERVVEITYIGGGAGIAINGSGGGFCPINVLDPEDVCVAVQPKSSERYVKVEFLDAAGQKVTGDLVQGGADADSYEYFGEFCGAHKKPVALVSSYQPLQINYYNGSCSSGEPSIVTTGTIRVTFSNIR